MQALSALIDRLGQLFSERDLIAIGVLAVAIWGMTMLIERAPRSRPSVSTLMSIYRGDWIREIAARDVRIMDAQLLSSLRGGAGFFASTCLISIGGVAALIGQADRLVSLVADLGGEPSGRDAAVWEAKLLAILLLLVNAFLKFVWSHRLFAYCAVLLGAMPAAGSENLDAAIRRSVEVNAAAARAFNRGLRTIYFALAMLAWFLGPEAMMAATIATAAMLYRREFLSRSRKALLPQ
ncbi:MAG: DUF599 family protein [Pseudomonadota bacterium]